MSNRIKLEGEPIREQLSDVSHAIWAHWMGYMFSVCEEQPDGGILIPEEKYQRWARQVMTEYPDLTEKEKGSDREQADKILKVIFDFLSWED